MNRGDEYTYGFESDEIKSIDRLCITHENEQDFRLEKMSLIEMCGIKFL